MLAPSRHLPEGIEPRPLASRDLCQLEPRAQAQPPLHLREITLAMKSIILVALLLLPNALLAASLAVGEPLPSMTLTDQHDQPHAIDAQTRLILFSADRDASALIEDALAEQTAESLDAAGILYVADISGMPGMVTKLIALPQMRKRPYPMLLGREAEETAMLPRERGQVTLIETDAGTITAIRFIDDEQALSQALDSVSLR